MATNIVPNQTLNAARRRRFLMRAAQDLDAVESNLRRLIASVRHVERRLQRLERRFRLLRIRHEAYEELILRCLEAGEAEDPDDMARLRDAIVRDHQSLKNNPFLKRADGHTA